MHTLQDSCHLQKLSVQVPVGTFQKCHAGVEVVVVSNEGAEPTEVAAVIVEGVVDVMILEDVLEEEVECIASQGIYYPMAGIRALCGTRSTAKKKRMYTGYARLVKSKRNEKPHSQPVKMTTSGNVTNRTITVGLDPLASAIK